MSTFRTILVSILFLVVGIFVGTHIDTVQGRVGGSSLIENTTSTVTKNDLDTFWEVWSLLDEKYPLAEGEASPSVQDRFYGATSGLVESFGDPYTTFLPPEESIVFTQDVQGDFGGVGMEIGINDMGVPMVIAPLENSPAQKAGIQAGDIIYKVDGEDVLEWSIDKVLGRIRGTIGTSVIITVARKETLTPLTFTIIRDRIEAPVVETEVDGDVFIISLYTFNTHASAMVKEALVQFPKTKAKSIILDLRGNPGGILDEAVSIASMFLPEGSVVAEERGKSNYVYTYRTSGTPLIDASVPLIVLVDAGSASASEILAGALQDSGRAQLLGTNTFGKGSVQELVALKDSSSLKVTVAHWYTPKGISISKRGLEPDITVLRTYEDAQNDYDPQLVKAKEALAQKTKIE